MVCFYCLCITDLPTDTCDKIWAAREAPEQWGNFSHREGHTCPMRAPTCRAWLASTYYAWLPGLQFPRRSS